MASRPHRSIAWTAALIGSISAARAEAPDDTISHTLASARPVERQTLDQLRSASSWARRAVAAVRLERFDCDESREILVGLLADPSWQVRAFSLRTLGRRGVPAAASWLEHEDHPRVIRTALRYRYEFDPVRLSRGANFLAKQNGFDQKMLAAELAATSDDPELQKLARETVKTIILRMDRATAGSLSPRLAVMTRRFDLRRHYQWQRWLMKSGRTSPIHPGHALPAESGRPPLSALAAMEVDRFADVVDYMESLRTREIDLAICLDTTASMWQELAEVQAGIDDLMHFIGDVVDQLHVGIIAYRDRRDRYQTKGLDFSLDVEAAREWLWQLDADGGGDTPEAVHPAMYQAYTQLAWTPKHYKVLIVVGDAPPHVGYGTRCVEMAQRARRGSRLVTHVIDTAAKGVKHFPEIAEAGGGRCVSLEDDDSLIPEIAGLTLGDKFGKEFREFFETYLELCR